MNGIWRAVRIAFWGWVVDGFDRAASRAWDAKRWALLRLWAAEGSSEEQP